MKITDIRTRVVEWRGATVPPQPHFCTNPIDILQLTERTAATGAADAMAGFRFHGWLIVEIFTDAGHVGIGNAALAPRVTKQTIDLYLKPLLIGADPWDVEFLWQHMYRRTMAFGRKGIGMTAISAVDIALWDILGKAAGQPVFRLLGGRTKPRIPVYASRLYSQPLEELAAETKKYKDQGFTAMKLRVGWGPVDGAEGMQRNVDLVRTVRETAGDGIDIMADAYMGWTLDYARRMIPLLERFNLRWLEEPVIPDDLHGYAALKAMNRIPIAGGEHAFTRARVSRSARREGARLHSVRHQSRRRHHAGPQDRGARGSPLGAGRAACRPDAQFPRRHGELQLADRRVLSAGGRRGGERALLLHLRRRAGAGRRLHRSQGRCARGLG